MGYIDLHVHSRYSDGKFDILNLLQMAKENNVTTISFTEHYNLSSLRTAKKLIKTNKDFENIEIVPGIEIGSTLKEYRLSKSHVCHILAYYVCTKIYPVLNEYEEERNGTNERIINKLKENGINISFRKMINFVGEKTFGRYDIAKFLVKKGYAYTPEDAYAKYLDYGQMAHVERKKMGPEKLINDIIKCGGVPILAHPRSLKLNNKQTTDFIKLLVSVGLAGIEVYNPRNNNEERNFYLNLSDELGIIPTVGTDFHSCSEGMSIGKGINNNLCIDDYSIITRLKEKKHEIG